VIAKHVCIHAGTNYQDNQVTQSIIAPLGATNVYLFVTALALETNYDWASGLKAVLLQLFAFNTSGCLLSILNVSLETNYDWASGLMAVLLQVFAFNTSGLNYDYASGPHGGLEVLT
jgi:hypothetical protein